MLSLKPDLERVGPTHVRHTEASRGNLGSRLRTELARRGQRLPLLGDNDVTADRNYIREFILARRRALGRNHGVEYAEAFHYIAAPGPSAVEDYVRKNAVPSR